MRVISTILLLVGGSPLSGQEIIDLRSFRSCMQCEITREPYLKLGNAVGDGVIEHEATTVVHDPISRGWVAYVTGRARVLLFGPDGEFRRSLVREGAGPGEITRVYSVDYRAGRITILDSRGDKWLTVDDEGRILMEKRLGMRYGPFFTAGADTVVMGAADQRPEAVGYPLHLVSIASGSSKHFGSATGEWNMALPYAREVLIAPGTNGRSVWRADRGRLHFEEWSLDGHHIRTVAGELDYFPTVRAISRLGERPNTRMLQFAVDSDARLWVLSRTADEDWRTAATAARSAPEGAIRSSNDYMDVRLDVFDINHRAHLGSLFLDEGRAGLVLQNNAVLLSIVEYDDELNPHVALYRLHPTTQ